MITYNEFQKALKIVNEYKTQLETHFKEVEIEVSKISKFANINKEMNILDTDLSVRLINILKANDEKLGYVFNWEGIKIKELENLSMSKFLECRCAGKGALQELKELCFYAGVSLQP